MPGILRLVIILNIFIYKTTAEYNIDILEIQCSSATPDIFDVDLKVVSPSRGVFRFSGFMDFKVDIDTDATIVEGKVYYSSNGITYQLTPFHIGPQTFTRAMNYEYKLYSMQTMNECCRNAPAVVKYFRSPLTKRLIECDNCPIPGDNLPTRLRLGYYRYVVLVNNGPSVNCSFLTKLEVD